MGFRSLRPIFAAKARCISPGATTATAIWMYSSFRPRTQRLDLGTVRPGWFLDLAHVGSDQFFHWPRNDPRDVVSQPGVLRPAGWIRKTCSRLWF